MAILKAMFASIICMLALTACATNSAVNVPQANQAGVPSASVNSPNNDFIFRSPPAAALQAHGLVR